VHAGLIVMIFIFNI